MLRDIFSITLYDCYTKRKVATVNKTQQASAMDVALRRNL